MNAEALRGDDLPFEVIADHPGPVRADSEHFHRLVVGSFLGLAEAVFALDLDVVETVFKGEPHDLGALRLGRPVGDQKSLGTLSPSPRRSATVDGLRAIGELDLSELD